MIETRFIETKVGIVPADWNVVPLKQITSVFGRIGFRGYNVTDLVPESQGAITLSPSNIQNGVMVYDKLTYLSWEKYEESPEIMIQEGDILFVKTGSTYGKTAYVEKLPWPSTINPQFVVFKKTKCNPRLLSYLLAQHNFQDQVESITSGGAIPTMSQRKLLECFVALPPKDENDNDTEANAIARALSDIDSLISTLQELIEKKRNVKHGAMQELLTGNKRISGFSKPWESIPLEEILKYEQPAPYLVSSKNYSEYGTPVLTAGKTFVLGYTSEKDGIYTDLPVIIFDDFVTESKYVDFRFKAKSSAMKMLHLRNNKHNLRFIYEIMQLISFYAPEHKRYWISRYSKIKVMVPEKEEQDAIVGILSDMDAEIIALAGKLEKYQSIKQGMMQQLLTGKIRLI